MEKFCYGDVQLKYGMSITYISKGMEFSTDTTDFNLELERETQTVSPYFVKTRAKITNTSDEEIFIKEVIPVLSDSLSLKSASPTWKMLIHGRHKNDLPSVCTAGVRDECFMDAVNRLSEEGALISDNIGDEVTFHSDLLTIINDGKNSAAFLVCSSGTQLTFCDITVDREGNFKQLSLGGEFNCILKPGETRYTQWFGIDLRSDWRVVTDEFSKERAKDRIHRHRKPAVYSTWYYYGREITAEDVEINLGKIKEKSLPFNCFQIDSGWEQCYGSWVPNNKFPDIRKTAENIRKTGMMAGIWTCPFVAALDSIVAKEHPDWLLRHNNGSLCEFIGGKIQYAVLDLTNPEVIEWIKCLYKKLVSWGYNYHKLDFTRAFPVLRNIKPLNSYKTVVEAYVEAMRAVREAIGEDSYLEVCGGLYDPLIGIADAQRTGADVRSMWIDPATKKPRIPMTIKQNVLRYFMNEWWDNDPDSLMARRNSESVYPAFLDLGILNDEEAKIFTLNQYAGGGLVCSTEALDKIEEDRLMLLRHIVPITDTKVMPAELFNQERYPQIVDVTVNGEWHTLCIFNWSENKLPIEVTLDEKLCNGFIERNKTYSVSEFFSGKVVKKAVYGDEVSLGEIEPHSAAVVKIAERSKPQIIRSNMHFSMGGELDVLEISDNILAVEFEHKYKYPLSYTVLLPEGYAFENSEKETVITADIPGKVKYTYKVSK